MSEREIPQQFEYTCDGCGCAETLKTRGRPKFWSALTVARDAYDYQGFAVADGTIKRLLCGECSTVVTAAMNEAIKSRIKPGAGQ